MTGELALLISSTDALSQSEDERSTAGSRFRLVTGRGDLGRARAGLWPRLRRAIGGASRARRLELRTPVQVGPDALDIVEAAVDRGDPRCRLALPAAAAARLSWPARPSIAAVLPRASIRFSSSSFSASHVRDRSLACGLVRATRSWSLTPRSASDRAPLARAATRMSTSPGLSARVTVRDWTERSSGRVNTWPAASTSTFLRIVSPWISFLSVESYRTTST